MITNKALLKLAYLELVKSGAPTVWENGKNSLRISRDYYGSWFLTDTSGLSKICDRRYLQLACYPNLTKLLKALVEQDQTLMTRGGRVFVTETSVFRKMQHGQKDDYVI